MPVTAAPSSCSSSSSWLLLVHLLPPRPSNLRVKTWRRLQDLGAVALKNSVYVLPNIDACREDFEWITSEIQAKGGEAAVFTAETIDSFSNDDVVAAFRRAREADYTALDRDAQALTAAAGKRTPRPSASRKLERGARQVRERLAALHAITFFPPANRDAAVASVARLERLSEGSAEPAAAGAGDRLRTARFQKRVWVTRPRPGVDRMSSAWLIRRFVDPKARFAFAGAPPAGGSAIPFDMYGVELSHTDHGCTFETLVARFGLASPPIDRIAHAVHDLDLKQTRYNAPEAPALAHLVDGLRQMHSDDSDLLEHGIGLFEALYRSFASSGGRTSPRARPERTGRRRK